MQRTLVVLGCALCLAGGSALAQQQQQSDNASGASITDKAKHAAQILEEKAKHAAAVVKEKAQETAHKAKEVADDKTAQSGQGEQGGTSATQQMQKKADADYKSAKDKCEPMQQKAQKTLCEKQAAAAHANAEVDIAKASVAAEGGTTNRMGAGKSTH
jgi:hypothetical protein